MLEAIKNAICLHFLSYVLNICRKFELNTGHLATAGTFNARLTDTVIIVVVVVVVIARVPVCIGSVCTVTEMYQQ